MNVDKMIALGKQSSAIRELFEYGNNRKKEIGEDKVFDFDEVLLLLYCHIY